MSSWICIHFQNFNQLSDGTDFKIFYLSPFFNFALLHKNQISIHSGNRLRKWQLRPKSLLIWHGDALFLLYISLHHSRHKYKTMMQPSIYNIYHLKNNKSNVLWRLKEEASPGPLISHYEKPWLPPGCSCKVCSSIKCSIY